MNILILNGSPAGDDSITLQTLMDNDGSRKHVGCGR